VSPKSGARPESRLWVSQSGNSRFSHHCWLRTTNSSRQPPTQSSPNHVYLPAICAFLWICRCSLCGESPPHVPRSRCRSTTAAVRRWCSAVSSLPSFPIEHLSDESLSGVAAAVGAAFGTSKAGIGISGIGTFKPELIMKVGAQEIVELTRADQRVPSVADSSSNVWYHCRVRAGGICANIRKSCVPSPLFYPRAGTKCRLFSCA